MRPDRYLKIVLTVIAIELAWLGMKELVPGVAAQADATRVVITGVQIEGSDSGFVPVAIVGGYREIPPGAAMLRPMTTRIEGDVAVRVSVPVKVEADRPLPVNQVAYTPGERPGE